MSLPHTFTSDSLQCVYSSLTDLVKNNQENKNAEAQLANLVNKLHLAMLSLKKEIQFE